MSFSEYCVHVNIVMDVNWCTEAQDHKLVTVVLFPFTGDTIDRLSTLHELLAEAADWPRVVQCAQTVPVLLHIFFNTVITVKR